LAQELESWFSSFLRSQISVLNRGCLDPEVKF